MQRRMHITVGYALRILREGSPELKQALLADGASEAEALAELESMRPDALVSCGHADCPDCATE